MKKTTQKLRTSQPTATAPMTALKLNEPPAPWHQHEWMLTGLPQDICRRMSELEDAFMGLDGVTQILQDDTALAEDARIDDSLTYTPLSVNVTSKLIAAQRVLVGEIHACLEDVKDRLMTHEKNRSASVKP